MGKKESVWKKCLSSAQIDFIKVANDQRVRRVLTGTEFLLLDEFGSACGHDELIDLVRQSRECNTIPQIAIVVAFMWFDGEITANPLQDPPPEILSVLPAFQKYFTLNLFTAVLDRFYNIENRKSNLFADRFYPSLGTLTLPPPTNTFSA